MFKSRKFVLKKWEPFDKVADSCCFKHITLSHRVNSADVGQTNSTKVNNKFSKLKRWERLSIYLVNDDPKHVSIYTSYSPFLLKSPTFFVLIVFELAYIRRIFIHRNNYANNNKRKRKSIHKRFDFGHRKQGKSIGFRTVRLLNQFRWLKLLKTAWTFFSCEFGSF